MHPNFNAEVAAYWRRDEDPELRGLESCYGPCQATILLHDWRINPGPTLRSEATALHEVCADQNCTTAPLLVGSVSLSQIYAIWWGEKLGKMEMSGWLQLLLQQQLAPNACMWIVKSEASYGPNQDA